MPKNIHTPREELVCGKLEAIAAEVYHLGSFKQNEAAATRIMEILSDITHDVGRMEQKLISRKQESNKIPGNVNAAIDLFLKFGDETTGKTHNGHYGKGGWPYETLNRFLKNK